VEISWTTPPWTAARYGRQRRGERDITLTLPSTKHLLFKLDPAASRTNLLSRDPFVKMRTIQRVNMVRNRVSFKVKVIVRVSIHILTATPQSAFYPWPVVER